MPETKVDLPDRTLGEIDQMVERGEFMNREQAMEELLELGLSAFGPEEDTDAPLEPDMFSQSVSDQEDPAALGDPDDEMGY